MFQIYNPQRDKKIIKKIVIAMIIFAAFIIVKDEILFQFGYSDEYIEDDYYEEESSLDDCNVRAVALQGDLVTYISKENLDEEGYPIVDQAASEDIVYYIEEAEKDDSIKAIIIEIDSLGGFPVADEEVADALKRAKKPTVALIRAFGISAAYYAATGADIIFASKDSDIGGIAVSMSYLDYVKQNQQEGLTYNQLSSGRFKDTGDPNKLLTAQERALLMRDNKIMHENFIKAVAENRDLDLEKVRQLADGSSMLGEMALENGLIDRIGGFYEVGEYLGEVIEEEVEVCW